MEPSPSRRFFRGAELVRLLVLAVVMVAGWGLVWEYRPQAAGAGRARAPGSPRPEPVVPDRAVEFETVTDRTPSSFRDNAAYAYLLEKTRGLSPAELARQSRRDIVLTHLWERPELYRGVPIHLQGTAMRVIRYEAKMSKTGWLYEAWISHARRPQSPLLLRLRGASGGLSPGGQRVRAGGLQRLLPQDHEVRGRRHHPRLARAGRQDRLGARRRCAAQGGPGAGPPPCRAARSGHWWSWARCS